MQPENKDKLTSILTYHVIPGRITARDIAAKAKANGGTATYTTVQGEPIMFKKAMALGHHGRQGRYRPHHYRRCHAVKRRRACYRYGDDAINDGGS